jgi:ketosteroid isomerase-like protein
VYAKLASQAYDKALKLDSSNAGAQNKLALVRELVGAAPRETAAAMVTAAATPTTSAPKPAAPKPSAPKPAAQEPRDVLEAVAAWAEAWSRKDANAYLAAYARDFRTPKGEPRSDWEQQRRERVTAPKSISVKIDFTRVVDKGDGRVSVTFRQNYQSDRFSGSAMKTLLMGKSEDGRWRILQEQVSN